MKRALKCFGFLGVVVLFYSCNSTGSSTNKPAVDTVVIQAMKFTPEVLTVHKYDTVVWINQGLVSHNITSFPEKDWASDTIAVQTTWKKAITDSFSYFCSIHPVMHGKILIEKK